jgi:serine/threonine-protein kinase RsbW
LSEQVHLRIPATTGHTGLARATATALAARLDFTYDRLMDLHIAIDEACGRVLAVSDPPSRMLSLIFEIHGEGLAIAVHGDGRLKPGGEFLNPWSKLILESVTSDFQAAGTEEPVGASFRIDRGEAS